MPDHPALVESTGTWTYKQLAAVIDPIRSWLEELRVRPGDRVMIVSENCSAVVVLFLATSSLDAWPVIVNARLSDREIDQIRDHSGARRVLYTVNVSARAKFHGERHGATVQNVGELGPIGIGPINEATEPESVESDPRKQVAALVYTSGTTGEPKGVMLTHDNLLFVARTSGMLRSLGPGERVHGAPPFSHILGLSVIVLATLLYGATLYPCSRFDPAETLTSVERDRLTVMIGTPAMFTMLVEYARRKGQQSLEGHALRVLASAGAPLDPAVKLAAEHFFGVTLHNGYGVTECSPTISQTRIDTPRTDCSVGPLWPGIEAKLVDVENDQSTGVGVGELWVRGPNVMKGYYKAPRETASVIDREGWFNTRDLARIDTDGHLFIVGRTRELIIRFGYNIYPSEIEAVLNSHPAVIQTAVIGRSVHGTEEIIAFVQPALEPTVTAKDLAEYAAKLLAPYKRPSEIVFVATMPTNSAGKILKRELSLIAAARLENGPSVATDTEQQDRRK
jgi:long-chain acyl-CoA synthetase